MTLSFRKSVTLVLALTLIHLSGSAAAAPKALYAFGDSFVDTGNDGVEQVPYGETWPGKPGFRASDGRNQADYFAELFGVPSPTPSSQVSNDSQSVGGVNFAQKGAGVTYAFGKMTLDTQVNNLAALVESGALSRAHLNESVALVSIGVNDYSVFNRDYTAKTSSEGSEVNTTVSLIVDGIALALLRLHSFGLRNVVVANLANMACSPYITEGWNFTSCSTNDTLLQESQMHNALLRERVQLLKRELPSSNLIVVDQYKAFDELFHDGAKYGFEETLVPCCIGKCGGYSAGEPLYKLCKNPKKAVIFDGIHPTDAAWKVVIGGLYASAEGFTHEGPNLITWMRRNFH